MPIPKKYYEAMQESRAQSEREARSETRRDLTRTALVCWGWSLLGVFCMMWSFHTTNVGYGKIAFFAGIIIGVGGQLYALGAAYRRGEARGDW